jgi:hypothetical protein
VLLVLEPALFAAGFVLTVMSVGGRHGGADLLGRWAGSSLPALRGRVEALALTFSAGGHHALHVARKAAARGFLGNPRSWGFPTSC